MRLGVLLAKSRCLKDFACPEARGCSEQSCTVTSEGRKPSGDGRSRKSGLATVDQFNKKRVLLPQTLDISYSGVHGNKKFPTVEGPEVVR